MLDSTHMELTPTLIQRIRRHYLFSGLAEADFSDLARQMSLQHLAKGEVLFLRGDPADTFFYVAAGQIELVLTAPNGKRKVIEVFTLNRTFAEAIAFMREQRYPVSAQALVDSQLIRIPNSAYVNILYGNPDACMSLLGNVCQHLHRLVTEIERTTLLDARSRLCVYLLDLATGAEGDVATVELDLPRHVLASKLSIKPETLSRILHGLQSDGTLEIHDRTVNIAKLEGLREEIRLAGEY